MSLKQGVLRRDVLSSPQVAWPTLLFMVATVAVWSLGVVLGATCAVPAPFAFLLCSIGAYAAFTPLHEAAHRAVARRRWVNEVVGRIAAVPLLGAFPAARWLHLEHHKHTNDPVADPDHYCGRGSAMTLPLRWLTQDLNYYVLYARSFGARQAAERIEVAGTVVTFLAVGSALAVIGHAREVLLFWILPARLAVGVLSFAFDWLPHRPHVVTAKADRFRATRVLEGRLLLWLLVGQSLHLVHHLYPAVPFYRYPRVWRSGLCEPLRSNRHLAKKSELDTLPH